MTNIDDGRGSLIRTVKDAYTSVQPALEQLLEDYEYAVYRAKKPVRDAVEAAVEAGIPMKKIVAEATDFSYQQKLTRWLAPPPTVAEKFEDEDEVFQATEQMKDTVDAVVTVARDERTGVVKVWHGTKTYEVTAIGPDSSLWAERDPSVPNKVYELILERYPDFVLLEDEE